MERRDHEGDPGRGRARRRQLGCSGGAPACQPAPPRAARPSRRSRSSPPASAPTCRSSSSPALGSAGATAADSRRSTCRGATGSCSSCRAGAFKVSTGSVYARFDDRDGQIGFDGRLAALLDAVASVNRTADLARLPPNDLAASPLSQRLLDLGAFRADVTGAGPCIYGLFSGRAAAEDAPPRCGLMVAPG